MCLDASEKLVEFRGRPLIRDEQRDRIWVRRDLQLHAIEVPIAQCGKHVLTVDQLLQLLQCSYQGLLEPLHPLLVREVQLPQVRIVRPVLAWHEQTRSPESIRSCEPS